MMRDAELTRARRVAASLPEPFAEAVDLWIDVLQVQGSRSSPALASGTIYSYVQNAHPTLKSWAESGITDLREITKKDVEAAIMGLPSVRRHSVHPLCGHCFGRCDVNGRSSEIPHAASPCPSR